MLSAGRQMASPGNTGQGLGIKQVLIRDIDVVGDRVLATDTGGLQLELPLSIHRVGVAPEIGQTWLVDQALGFWSLAAFVGAEPGSSPGTVVASFSYTGALSVYGGDFRWYNDTGRALTFGTVRASVGTAPTGAAVVVDVLQNGSTIFSTTGNRPTIAAGAYTGVNTGTPDTTTLPAGAYLTVSIAQIGSSVPGADLTLTVVMT